MDLTAWLLAEHDDTQARLRGQVQRIVPADARTARLPGGNSIRWATYHVARHAALALVVAGAGEPGEDRRLAAFPPEATAGGAGLQEVEQPWAADLDLAEVDAYAAAVAEDVRAFLGRLAPADLDRTVDAGTRLRMLGVDPGAFGWLYGMWDAALGFLVRWPMLGHWTNHVGEMIATRNQLGYSPFR
ncbi:DinB family protein [Amnibacterium sp.]|uniref:DinB family protein n=1 Tax=Amnibacterium sp. TaxID=1872496 RepID=UPI002622CC3B|nr:DinB family protein [Amnibacterium sp.]MCU1474854.1 hypothetical protein [Amnibacterium sp.]